MWRGGTREAIDAAGHGLGQKPVVAAVADIAWRSLDGNKNDVAVRKLPVGFVKRIIVCVCDDT
jgi:hypothetical protein